MERTELEELGEFGLIKELTNNIELHTKKTILGVGDDASILNPDNKKVVVSSDMLLEGVHFDLSYVPLKHLGYKSISVNLSDIYAMNAEPVQILVNIGISNRFSLEALNELYDGIKKACEIYKVDFVGGDTSSSQSGLTISVTAIGLQKEELIVKRSGANENDLICVSGDLGAAFIGLKILDREKRLFMEDQNVQPDLSGADYLIERQLKPEPRADIIRLFSEKGIVPTSMIDISDGLASEVFHIADQSNVGCRLYTSKIPIDPLTVTKSEEFKVEPLVAALNGGEDYELLFTVSQTDFEKINDMKEISVIGHVMDKASGVHLIDEGENLIELTAQGWDAFLKQKKEA